jgi:hypothetical protein
MMLDARVRGHDKGLVIASREAAWRSSGTNGDRPLASQRSAKFPCMGPTL